MLFKNVIPIIINHSYIGLIEFCTFLGMLTSYSTSQGIEVMLCDIFFFLLYLWNLWKIYGNANLKK